VKTPRAIVIIFVTAVCTLFLAAPALAAVSLNNYEKQLVSVVNKQRAKHSLAQLRVNAKLVDAARGHSTDMAEQKFFAHNSPSGETWSSRIIRYGYTREGYSYWKVGENIYYGAGLYSSPYVAIKAWMASKAHRAVILTKVFRNIGVGAVKTDDGYGDIDGTVWFFTLDLGRRIAQ
jgi:uncharacterized protein YkwD